MVKFKFKKKKEVFGEFQVQMILENCCVWYKFEFLEYVECGFVLIGSEVKSFCEGKVLFDEVYGRICEGEFWLMGCDIFEYKQVMMWNYEFKCFCKMFV